MESVTVMLKITEEQLVSELWTRDVPFLTGEQISFTPQIDPATLIQSLAQSKDARVRMALIPLFLRHPRLFGEAKIADQALLGQSSQLFLRFYYTAAMILQQKYWERLVKLYGEQVRLPDLFSSQLGILFSENKKENLAALAKRHQILSGQYLNWLETYEHSAESLVRYVEKFR